MRCRGFVIWIVLAACVAAPAVADPPKRLLLLGQEPDNHPPASHEYLPGLRILDALLADVDAVDTRLVVADVAWADSENLLASADGAVVFLSQGAQCMSAEPARIAAFQALAARGGGLAVLHWGMGTKPAENIGVFVELFGGCHGGPDRKYQVVETTLRPTAAVHPVLRGVTAVDVHDEFYYRLKQPAAGPAPTPLLEAEIDGTWETVGWAWQRADGGRSFGFSGLHFHKNWEQEAYRRAVLQGVLWSVGVEIPDGGMPVDVDADVLALPAPNP